MKSLKKLTSIMLLTMILASVLVMPKTMAAPGAATKPSCAVLKFVNDSRFQKLDADAVLSDYIVEKMIASNRFQLKESKPLTEETESLLFNEYERMKQGMRQIMQGQSGSALFEGPGFNENQAYSLATAKKGQVVSPDIIATIGKNHNVDYLVQGTIVFMGRNRDEADANMYVYCNTRLLEAASGKVVWEKMVDVSQSNSAFTFKNFLFGSSKLDMNMYSKVMEKAAKKIVNSMVADLDAGILLPTT